MPHLPSALDFVKSESDRKVMQLYFTQKTIARPVVAPPGVPAPQLGALRGAFAAIATDQDFLADAVRFNLEVAPLAGEAVDRIVSLISGTPADVAEHFARALARSWGARRGPRR